MKKQISLIICTLILTLSLILIGGAKDIVQAASSDTYNVNLNVTYQQTSAREMLKLINEFRTGNDAWYYNPKNEKVTNLKLNELKYDYNLEKVAMQRALEIAIYYSHTRPNGTSTFTAFNEQGITFYAAGENIAAGYPSVASVFEGWQETNEMYSGQGHRRNMLGDNFNAIGIGCVKYNGIYYWVQEFAYIPNINTNKTKANDSETAVTAKIAKANISNVIIEADKNVTVPSGKSVNIPNVTTKLLTTEEWPGVARNVTGEYSYKVADTSIIKVENNKITGLKPGSTTLTISILGKEHVMNVEVKDSNTASKDSIENGKIVLDKSTFEFTGAEIKPTLNVSLNGNKLDATNYTVSYSDNIKVGKATVTISGAGDYIGTLSTSFDIVCEHKETKIINFKAATTTEEGYTGDTVCSICGEVIKKGSTIPKLDNTNKEDTNVNNNNANKDNTNIDNNNLNKDDANINNNDANKDNANINNNNANKDDANVSNNDSNKNSTKKQQNSTTDNKKYSKKDITPSTGLNQNILGIITIIMISSVIAIAVIRRKK